MTLDFNVFRNFKSVAPQCVFHIYCLFYECWTFTWNGVFVCFQGLEWWIHSSPMKMGLQTNSALLSYKVTTAFSWHHHRIRIICTKCKADQFSLFSDMLTWHVLTKYYVLYWSPWGNSTYSLLLLTLKQVCTTEVMLCLFCLVFISPVCFVLQVFLKRCIGWGQAMWKSMTGSYTLPLLHSWLALIQLFMQRLIWFCQIKMSSTVKDILLCLRLLINW